MDYSEFIETKSQLENTFGFEPIWLPDELFDFQKYLVDWAIRAGRALIAADCGMGKTLMQLVWAENVVRHTNKRVLILTPLAVAHQTINEGKKFGVECKRSKRGELFGSNGVIIANYERLQHFNAKDFVGVVCS